MSFDLINITAFAVAFAAIAGLTVVLTLAAGVEFFASNHRVRVARHQTIPVYYGNLLGAH